MARFDLLVVVCILSLGLCAAEPARPWMDQSLTTDPSARAKALLAKMDLAQKITLLHGTTGPYVGNVAAVPELGIPAILMNDGPQGFRAAGHPGTSTQWPSGLAVAATWNRDTMKDWGVAMGQEFVGKGANVQLGPGLCLARVPECGRNFEYLSGEDPFLGSQLSPMVVNGIQSQGVMATSKHYVNNQQETNRHTISENLDERTEFEMYLPPFEAAVNAGTLAIMCSYNKINETWSCENSRTLGYLKETMGFKYFVMSDWGATHSTVESAFAGLDQEQPSDEYFGSALQANVLNGTIPQSVVDDKVLRILTSMFTIGMFDTKPTGNINSNVTSVAHNRLARSIAGQSAVLLQNEDNMLPLNNSTLKSIAVIGTACSSGAITGGTGSGAVSPPYIITPLQGITNRAGPDVSITYVPTGDTAAAVAAAKAADVALVCTATISGEGHDRVNLSLPFEEDALIAAVAAVQSKTAALVVTPGAVLMPWADKVAAIVMQFMPGQEAGNALADVLFGLVNPSGRTPLTMPMIENQMQFTQLQWPGVPAGNPAQSNYTEHLEVGYRWYTAHKSVPRFAFGHGLSYSTFEYAGLQVAASGSHDNNVVCTVNFTLSNTGKADGATVPQLYLGFPATAGEPPMQLKGFENVFIKSGESTPVSFAVTKRDISIWDTGAKAFVPQSGVFTVSVAESVENVVLSTTISL